jgi:prevent-host-death family protein
MPRELTQRELRNESGEIMRALDRGDRFVVTRRGVPVGELTPVGRHRTVSATALLDALAAAPALDAERLRADLDALADQDPTPRA